MGKELNKEYLEYIHSDEWKKRRNSFLKEEKKNGRYFCALCMLDDDSKFQVHHRSYLTFGNESSIHLIILCSKCHEAFHTGKDFLKNGIPSPLKVTKKAKKSAVFVDNVRGSKKIRVEASIEGHLTSYNNKTIREKFYTGAQFYSSWCRYMSEHKKVTPAHLKYVDENRDWIKKRCEKLVSNRAKK